MLGAKFMTRSASAARQNKESSHNSHQLFTSISRGIHAMGLPEATAAMTTGRCMNAHLLNSRSPEGRRALCCVAGTAAMGSTTAPVYQRVPVERDINAAWWHAVQMHAVQVQWQATCSCARVYLVR